MITVCSLAALAIEAERVRPAHVISLVDPGQPVSRPAGVAPSDHLVLEFHDITAPLPGHVAPRDEDIERLIAFGEAWGGTSPTLIHCHAGISRSPAAAFILMCQANAGREDEAALALRRHGPHALPNRRMVELGDILLGRGGRLVAALRAMPPATFSLPGPISLPARL